MATTARDEARSFNKKIIEEFRANGGRVGGFLADTPMILIHHLGARSGIQRVTPVACCPLRDGRYAIVASNGGSRTHPAWYHNLTAHPRITAEYGTATFPAMATELRGANRAEMWPAIVARYPDVGRFQSRTARQLPVLLLTRCGRQPLCATPSDLGGAAVERRQLATPHDRARAEHG